MRYVQTIDLYIYADSDIEAKEKAENNIKKLQDIEDNKARTIDLCQLDFGKTKPKKI